MLRVRAMGTVALVLSLGLGCEEQSAERTREVVDEATRSAEKGVQQAREGLADARERYEIDARVEDAKRQLGDGMDEAAASFSELAESGKAHVNELSDRLAESGQAGVEVTPEAIDCVEGPASRVCRVDPDLVARLAAEPKLLAREVSLRPKRGSRGNGLQLMGVRAQSLTALLGLREGDILLEINGAKLGSFDAIRAVDEALSGKAEATLIYERDGAREQLTIIQQRGK